MNTLYVNNNSVTYFDFFGVEHIPKEIKAFIDHSLSITTNIFRIQAYDSIICAGLQISAGHRSKSDVKTAMSNEMPPYIWQSRPT